MNFKGFYFFGVFDGHGFYGHLVSDFIKKYVEETQPGLFENILSA